MNSLRLWPGVVIVTLQSLAWFVAPVLVPEAAALGAFAALFGGLAVAVWWAFFSRAPRSERWGAVVWMIFAMVATPYILHESIATGGMGLLFYVYAVPVLSLAFVLWAVLGRRLPDGPRRAAMVATILLACGVWALFQTHGTFGAGSEFAWRWADTPEDRLLAHAGPQPMEPMAPIALETASRVSTRAEWPGFRGPNRDGTVPGGVRIETDWVKSPPVELWRRPIGPGWSSFAVRGDLLYTQEQRGDDEIVACHLVTTGEPVWRHRDEVRFWESNAGAGPRATPTLSDGRVYTFGATGILNALDAGTGAVAWSRDVTSDSGVEVPTWGFVGSPLVVDDLVIVAAAGRLAAYDRADGDPRWFGPAGGEGYSSPHLVTIDGIAQVLLLNGGGAISVTPADGALIWRHAWPGSGIAQPALTENGDILISALGVAAGVGIRRLSVTNGSSAWTAEELWTSTGLKPHFSDFVVHEGHAYGFDGRILSSIYLGDGRRKWKGGRYGNGQLVLLPDQDLLLVISEKGELALVGATPDGFTEITRFPAIEGKSWNHPVLVGDLLLVRNGQEMAAFRLALAETP